MIAALEKPARKHSRSRAVARTGGISAKRRNGGKREVAIVAFLAAGIKEAEAGRDVPLEDNLDDLDAS